MKKFNPVNADFSIISDFLKSEKLDDTIILLMQLYVSKNRENFQYLINEFLHITRIGFENINKEYDKSWSAIEFVLCLFSEKNISDDTYFHGTWKAFSILIPEFVNFDRHSVAIQNAYFKFEKIFEKKREKFLSKDYWFASITDYDWWLKVDEFYKRNS